MEARKAQRAELREKSLKLEVGSQKRRINPRKSALADPRKSAFYLNYCPTMNSHLPTAGWQTEGFRLQTAGFLLC